MREQLFKTAQQPKLFVARARANLLFEIEVPRGATFFALSKTCKFAGEIQQICGSLYWIFRLCPRSWGPNFSGDFPVRRRDCYLHRRAGASKAHSQQFHSTRFGAGAVAKPMLVGYGVRDTVSENLDAKFGGEIRGHSAKIVPTDLTHRQKGWRNASSQRNVLWN